MSRIYTLRDADAILPEIAIVVQRLQDLRHEVIGLRDAYLRGDGLAEGEAAEPPEATDAAQERELIRLRLRGLVDQMQADAAWLDEREIALRDIATGLLDFPSEAHGEPVWLCWRLGEASVTAWHPKDEGFASRRPVGELYRLERRD